MKKAALAGLVVFSMLLALSGCSNKGIDLDKNSTVAFDPVKDKPLEPGGGPGGKGAGPAMGGKGKKGAPAAGGQ